MEDTPTKYLTMTTGTRLKAYRNAQDALFGGGARIDTF